MKKLFAILCALACLAMLFIPAMAAPEGDTVTVHVQVPEGTNTPNIWAWGNGVDPMNGASWPGVAMTADGDWYTYEVPVGTTGMLVNTAGDTDKSDDITITGDSDVWVICSVNEGGKLVADSVVYENPDEAPAEDDKPVVDEEVKDEEVKDEEVKDEEVKDEEVKDEEVKDEAAKDEESKDESKATKPSQEDNYPKNAQERRAARMKVYLILGIALVLIVAVACVLSIPKKLT